ncbi:MAG: cell division protein FtsW [Candidatus Vogelbacteria bacterium]|nr:cell division protein FtsW [Candidatus Vogelbacteria bacterium]
MRKPFDKLFFGIVATLVLAGVFIFSSASLGLVAKGSSFTDIAFRQFGLGLLGGSIALILALRLNYHAYRKASLYIFLGTAMLTLLVFVPSLGLSHGGASRWISIYGFSLQPAELLKFGVVVYLASLFSSRTYKISSFKHGILPLLAVMAVVGTLLLKQPDTGTFAVIFMTILAMFLVAGGSWKHFSFFIVLSIAVLAGLAYMRPYVLDRLVTFLDMERDTLGASYQVRQALLAIGSGELIGRGFGQSVQKFNFLPEPVGDSIFAIAAEEFGFVGSSVIIVLFLLFTLRGLRIAARAEDSFGRLLALGLVILISSQSFVNIAAMLNIVPLTGVPLLFVSQGGTALLLALFEVGIILNISRYARR